MLHKPIWVVSRIYVRPLKSQGTDFLFYWVQLAIQTHLKGAYFGYFHSTHSRKAQSLTSYELSKNSSKSPPFEIGFYCYFHPNGINLISKFYPNTLNNLLENHIIKGELYYVKNTHL